ncbi:MAG: AsmA family protein [Rickettsiales bacterium]|nr:AsmA family protein [Rickettsiales bacterium]
MASLKRKSNILAELAFLLASVLLGLYFLPQFVDIGKYKPYIEEQVERLAGFDIDIRGAVTFEVLPTPSIILKNITVKKRAGAGVENPVFLAASQLFISINPLELAKGKLKIENIVIDGGQFDFATFKRSNLDRLDDFLTGKSFENLAFRNSYVTFVPDGEDGSMNDRIDGISINLKSLAGSGVKGGGSFSYRGNKVSNMDFVLNFFDAENYNLNIKFSYTNKKSNIDADMSLVKKDGEQIVSGSLDLSTNSLYEFLPQIDKRLSVPDIPLFRERLDIRTKVQTTSGAIILSDGVLDSGDTLAGWSGNIPYSIDAENNFKVPAQGMEFKLDFKNLKLDRFITVKRGFAHDPVALLAGNSASLSLLKHAKVAVTARNVILDGSAATAAAFSSSPVFARGAFSGISVDELSFSLAGEQFSASGKVSGMDSDLLLFLDVARTPSFNLPIQAFRTLAVSGFKGKLNITKDTISAADMDASLSGGHVLGSIDRTLLDGGRGRYELNLRSDSLDMNALTGEKMDLRAMLAKLAQFRNAELSLSGAFKRLSAGGENYDALRVDAQFADDNLSIRRLTFRKDGYSSDIKGEMRGITGGGGSFDNFTYVIASDDLKGVSIPMIRNSFIDRIVANGVNRVNIRLDGPADNPISTIHAEFENVKVDVGGELMDNQSNYHLHIQHDELKGFLFSWGFIDDRIAEHLYDNVPFTFDADIEGDDIKNIVMTIKNNRLAGNISRRNAAKSKAAASFDTSIDIDAGRLDLRAIFKRVKDMDAYVDLLLKMIRALKYDISLSAHEVVDYDGNVYKNLKMFLSNIRNPGSLRFDIGKGARTFSLSTEILNGRIFTGEMKVENYAVPGDLMNNELLNLAGGTMAGSLAFKTDGLNSYQVTSNMSGDFNVEITGGDIVGISGYDAILSGIVGLSNITTNSVLYALEESFKVGRLTFDDFSVSGRIENADIARAAFTMGAKNMLVSGFISTNLIKKSLSVESVFDITGLSFDTLTLIYNLDGFINNLSGKLDTTGVISKINTFYLQKKKRAAQ